MTNSPNYAAFSPMGELFVSNHNNGSVSRFLIDANGNYVANGTLTGNNLAAPHGLAFSKTGELFAANYTNGTISRFLFDAQGAAIPNGTIATGGANQGVAFSPTGELFNTGGSSVRRFLFDPGTGAAVTNGSFTVPGASGLHGLAFNSLGELFLTDPLNNRLVRYTFDGAGNPTNSGTISVAGGPIDVAFSTAGELFASCHFGGGLRRFAFDQGGAAISNGSLPFDHLGGVAIFDRGTPFTQADLAGTWHFQVFGDSPTTNAPQWGWGTMTIDAAGSVTGGTGTNSWGQTDTLAGGSFTIDTIGQVSGTIIQSNGVIQSVPYGKLDGGKTILTMVNSAENLNPNYRGIFVAAKAGGTFTQADLAGTWHFQVLGDSPSANAPYWGSGIMIVNTTGTVIGGTAVNDLGITKSLTGGSLTIDSLGRVTGTTTLSDGTIENLPHGKLDAGKTLLILVNSDMNFHGLLLAAKTGSTPNDHDGKTPVAAYHLPSNQFFMEFGGNLGQYGWGGLESFPLLWDFDGDRRNDISIYHIPTNQWFVKGYPGDNMGQFGWGQEDCIPTPGDYNGDGIMERAFYHTPSNTFFIEAQGGVTQIQFGWNGADCIPVPGDYNGDGTTDLMIYHVPSNQWLMYGAGNQGQYGWNGEECIPVPADYDGDGSTDIAVYHYPSNQWFVKGYPGDNLGQYGWGGAESFPISGDYNGDGIAERAFYRPAENKWFIEGEPEFVWGWGGAEFMPVTSQINVFNWFRFVLGRFQ
jgi:hypothetical protein